MGPFDLVKFEGLVKYQRHLVSPQVDTWFSGALYCLSLTTTVAASHPGRLQGDEVVMLFLCGTQNSRALWPACCACSLPLQVSRELEGLYGGEDDTVGYSPDREMVSVLNQEGWSQAFSSVGATVRGMDRMRGFWVPLNLFS